MKLKEISYINSFAIAAGELKHGTIALIEQDTLVIALSTQSKLFDKMISNNKSVLKQWLKDKGLSTGYLMGASE